MEKNQKSKKIKLLLLMHAGIILLLVLQFGSLQILFDSACPLYLFTHICCPFCGMTRAHLAALQLDFAAAFSYHPLFPIGLPYIFLACHDARFFGCKTKKWETLRWILLAILTVLLIGVYIFRVATLGFDFFAA